MARRALCLLSATAAACAQAAGTASVTFTFTEAPTLDGPASLSLFVEERADPDVPGRVLGTSDPITVEPGFFGALDVPDLAIPVGDARVVVLELRAMATGEVAYYGASAPFSLAAGEHRDVEVRVSPRAAPRLTLAAADAVDGRVASPRVTLVATTGARALLLSNFSSLDDAVTQALPASGAVTWDLDRGLPHPCGREDACARIVYARARDERGYTSPLVALSLVVDTAPPTVQPDSTSVLLPSARPWLAEATALSPSATATLTFAVSERLGAAPTITATPAVASRCAVDALVVRCAIVAPPSGDAASLAVGARLVDRVGNAAAATVARIALAPRPPAPPDVAKVVLERAPWGAPGGGPAPRFTVRGAPGAAAPGAQVVAFDGADTAGPPLARTTTAVAIDGSFTLTIPALSAARAAVGLVAVDAAGQPSDAASAPGVQAALTARGVLAIRVADPAAPARLLRAPDVAPTLSQPAADGVSDEARAALDVADGRAVTAEPGVVWTPILRTSEAPAPRYRAGMAFDRARGRAVLFGGVVDDRPQSDTWEYDGRRWRRLEPGLLELWPTARAEAGTVYEAHLGGVLVFGGEDTALRALDDAWLWDGRGWRAGPPLPAPRSAQAVAFDAARAEVIAFGGYTGQRTLAPATTWALRAGRWQELEPAHTPSARARASMAFDPSSGRVILFGGEGNPGAPDAPWSSDETWAWDGADWTLLETAAGRPPPRAGASMAYSATLGGVVLVGGRASFQRDFAAPALDDAWLWASGEWHALPADARFERSDATLSPIDHAGTLLLMGGRRAVSRTAVRDDAARLGRAGWQPEVLSREWPAGRRDAARAYDPSLGAWVVAGGQVATDTPTFDAWAWDGRAWRRLADIPAIIDPLLAFDEGRGALVLLGNTPDLTRLRVFERVGEAWVEQVTDTPAFGGGAAAYVRAQGGVVVFGYTDAEGGASDTRLWRGPGAGMSMLAVGAQDPSARRFHGAAAVPALDALWTFGGVALDGAPVPGALYALEATRPWSERIEAARGPGALGAAAMIADPRAQDVLVLGADTARPWAIATSPPSWRALDVRGASPGLRRGAALGATADAVWLFGGGEAAPSDELWSLDRRGDATPALVLAVDLGAVGGEVRALQATLMTTGTATREAWDARLGAWAPAGTLVPSRVVDAAGTLVLRVSSPQGVALDAAAVQVDYATAP